MYDVDMEYNRETGRYEGTYRVDCSMCGVRYTGIYDIPHICKERPIYSAMPILTFEHFEIIDCTPVVPEAFRKPPAKTGLTLIGVYTKLSM
jgi:hypothetical protein